MTSFVASPGHQDPQYCNNVIHSVCNLNIKQGLKVWLLKVRYRPGCASWFFDFFRFCSYLCSLQFQILLWITECNTWAKQHCPTHSIVVRWGQNGVDCSYFFNFDCSIIAKQIHWKMLMVVNHIPFLSWIYKCSMFMKLYVTVMYQYVYGNLIPIMLWIVYLAGHLMGLYMFTGTDHQQVIHTQ